MCRPVEMPVTFPAPEIRPVEMPTVSAPDCGDRMPTPSCNCAT